MVGFVSTLPRAGALCALDDLIGEAQPDSPFQAVTVLTPSARVAIHVARAITASRSADVARGGRGGLVNVNFVTLARLAEELGTAGLRARSRRRLTRTALTAAVRVELASRPRIFGEATMHPATAAEVADRYGELRFAGSLDSTPENDVLLGARAHLLLGVCREVRRSVAASFYDDVDLFESAVSSLGDDAAEQLGTVVVYLPDRARPCELSLLAALSAATKVQALVGLVGVGDLDEPSVAFAERLARRLDVAVTELGASGGNHAGAPDMLVTAATPRAEVRTAIRMLLDRLAEGASPERVGLLYPSREPYLPLLASELAAVGLDFNAPPVSRLAEEPPGRVLLALVDFVLEPAHRHDLISLLRAAPLLEVNGLRVPTAEWDRVSKLAGITGGTFREWSQHLGEYIRRQERVSDAVSFEASRSTDRSHTDVERNLAAARGLDGFVRRLALLVGAGASARGWEQIATWALHAIDELLGTPSEVRDDARDPESARDRVAAVIAEVAGLGHFEADLGLDSARPLIAEEFRRPGPRLGRTGRGVVVASIEQAMGVDFDVVVVVGCSTSNLPGGAPRSPLLERTDREALKLEPMTARAVAGRSERQFALLRQSAVELIATSPKLDSNGREMAPSRFVEEAHDKRPIAGVLAELSQVLADLPALRSAEFETAWLFARPAREVPAAAAALGLDAVVRASGAVLARDRREFGRYQGVVEDISVPSGAKPYSPTAIEEVATCAFRYFLSHVLSCEVIDDPEVVMSIEPMTKGSIIHEVLERFVAEEIAQAADAVTDAAARLGVIADEVMDQYERAGLTGKPVLFQAERRRIKIDLEAERLRDAAERLVSRRRPIQVEYAFGYGDVPAVELVLPNGNVAFRGKIDRTDVGEDGSITVIDYKSGNPKRFEVIATDPVDAGKHLQLPIYALAAASLAQAPDAKVRAEFRFVGPRSIKDGSFAIGIELNDEVRERLIETVDVLTKTVATGLFPMLPGDSGYAGQENCRFCDFDVICPTARDRYEESARGSGLASEYFSLLDGLGADSTSALSLPSGAADA